MRFHPEGARVVERRGKAKMSFSRIYMTHCSAKKDNSLKGTLKKVTPDRLYTATPVQRFINRCKETKVHWPFFQISMVFGFLMRSMNGTIRILTQLMSRNSKVLLGILRKNSEAMTQNTFIITRDASILCIEDC